MNSKIIAILNEFDVFGNVQRMEIPVGFIPRQRSKSRFRELLMGGDGWGCG